MNIPIFSKLTAKSRGRKVVRASARALRGGEEDYYEAEPNMKLSHAFMVVLILHVVAVGGIYAFNQVKVNKKSDLIDNISGKIARATGSAVPSAALVPEPAESRRLPGDADEPLPAMRSTPVMPAPLESGPPVVTTKPAAPAPAAPAPAAPAPVVTQSSPPKAGSKQVAAATKPASAGAASTTAAASPGNYKVAKGDNPYNIAKKFGVGYQQLLKVNGIDDPTKLQIGQVLKIPPKAN